MELLVIIIFIYAVHSAVEDTKAALRKSRGAYIKSADLRFPKAGKPRRAARAARHDAGFWLGQAANGFPVTRHGLAAGWHAGRKAQDEGRAARAAARADHLEARVRLIPVTREHLRRQRDALEQIRAEREVQAAQAGGGEGSPQPVMAPPSWAPGVVGWPGPARRNGESPAPPGGGGVPVMPATVPDIPDAGPVPRVCVACGNPEYGPRRGGGNWGPLVTYDEPMFPDDPPEPRLVHQAHFEDEATGYYGRPYQPAPAPDGPIGQPGETSEGSGEGTAAPETEPPASPTEGTQPMPAGEVTYDGVLASLAADSQNAEQRTNEQGAAMRAAQETGEAMQTLHMDPKTLSAMADHLDIQQAAFDALQRVYDSSENVAAVLKHNHQIMAAAHKDNPVDAADREFYDA